LNDIRITEIISDKLLNILRVEPFLYVTMRDDDIPMETGIRLIATPTVDLEGTRSRDAF